MASSSWRRRISWLLPLAGVSLLIALAASVSWRSVLSSLHGLLWPWLLAAIALAATSVSLRALRLSLALGRHSDRSKTWQSVCLGYFASLFLPLGGGELVKVAALNRLAGVSVSRATTALAIDRLFDISTLLALLMTVLGHGLMSGVRAGPVMFLAISSTIVMASLIFLMLSGSSLRPRMQAWTSRHPKRMAWLHRFDEIHDQTLSLRSPSLLGMLGLLQACIFAVDVTAAKSCLLAFPFGPGLPGFASLRLAFFTMVSFAVPLLPGGFGSHQAAAIFALAPFGLGISQALAVSLAGEATHVLTLTSLGIGAALASGLNPFRMGQPHRASDPARPPEEP